MDTRGPIGVAWPDADDPRGKSFPGAVDGGPSALGKEEAARHAWHIAVVKSSAISSLARPIHSHSKAAKLDLYALDPRPATLLGTITSLLVLAATVGYAAYLAVAYVHRPAMVTNTVEWSFTMGPFPLRVRCAALGGCVIVNAHNASVSWAGGVAVPAAQACLRLPYDGWASINLAYSLNPEEGLLVGFDPSNTSQTYGPSGYGLLLYSQMRCGGGPPCADGVMPMITPVAEGLTLVNYVKTDNRTSSTPGRLRHEWFAQRANRDAEPSSVLLECAAATMPGTPLETLAALRQARIRMQPFWNHVIVDRANTWVELWGTCGGAFGIFLQLGTAVLVAATLLLPKHPGQHRQEAQHH